MENPNQLLQTNGQVVFIKSMELELQGFLSSWRYTIFF